MPARPRRSEPFKANVTVTPSPWAPGKEIIHIGLQGYDIAAGDQPPVNLVFLIDVSGSMNQPNKLPLVQKALNVLIDQLRPEDRVSMVVYAGAAGAVLPPTAGNQKLTMRCAVEALHAGGSTAGGAGLALAYDLAEQNFGKEAVNRVVLMTDGDFNVGVADPEKLQDFIAEKRKTGVYLSAFGVGHGNYNDVMMQTLSAGRQRHRRLHRHARRGAQALPRRLLVVAVSDRRRRQDPGRVQPGRGRRVPPDRLRDAPARPFGRSTTIGSMPARWARGRR